MGYSLIDITRNDIKQRRTDPTHRIENFKGVEAQLVIDTNDGFRPVIMDGKTLGGKAKVALINHQNDFTIRPTVPLAGDVHSVRDIAVIPKGNIQTLINEAMAGAVEVKVIKSDSEISPSDNVKTFYFIENE